MNKWVYNKIAITTTKAASFASDTYSNLFIIILYTTHKSPSRLDTYIRTKNKIKLEIKKYIYI